MAITIITLVVAHVCDVKLVRQINGSVPLAAKRSEPAVEFEYSKL
jgi:hypothetical protein